MDLIAYTPKTLMPLALTRKAHNAGVINSAVQGNLFRRERREYSPPVQIAKAIRKPAPPALPPPNLKLKGVLLLGTKKIAIMEGDYPVREGNQAVKKKSLKKKGYPLGAQIGEFQLTSIEKNKVTLNDNRGAALSLNLTQRSQDKVIQKIGNSLVQKNRNFDPGKIKKAVPPRRAPPATIKPPVRNTQPVRAPRAFRISGAATRAPGAFKPHVSGR